MAVDLPPLKRIIQGYDRCSIFSLLGVGQRHRFRRPIQVDLKFDDNAISLGGIREYIFKRSRTQVKILSTARVALWRNKRRPSVAIAPLFPANMRLVVMRESSPACANDFYYLIFCYSRKYIIDVYPTAAKASCGHMPCT